MAATKKPSGLAIARNGLKFTFSWKIADSDYGAGHQLQWRVFHGNAWTSWNSVTITKTATTASITRQASAYYPTTNVFLNEVQFRVRGKRNPTTKDGKTTNYDWSDWAVKSFEMDRPNAPKLTATLSNSMSNRTTFAWATTTSTTDRKHFAGCEWQSILVKECSTTDGNDLSWKSGTTGWQTGTGNASGSQVITEDTTLLAQNSYTRWFRVRSRGCGAPMSETNSIVAYDYNGNQVSGAKNPALPGRSKWIYIKHVYAMPNPPKITKATRESGNNTRIRVTWSVASTVAHPIDLTEVQWTIARPTADLACPSGASWTVGASTADTPDKDSAFFLVDDAPGPDECLWVRVVVKHDPFSTSENATVPYYVFGDDLSAPTNLAVTNLTQDYKATVSASNNSDVPDSQLAVVFRQPGKKDVVVGVIPHGSSSITVQCPTWTSSSKISFGVYAFQGAATQKAGANGGYSYAINANMESITLWDNGTVPKAPSNVTAVQSGSDPEVILSWGWAWSDANQAEISWSENKNAWESTEEPSSYLIESSGTSKWRVSGLDLGKQYYFRVRLVEDTGETVTYGPYSKAVSVSLALQPEKPILILSHAVYQKDQRITASWSYVSGDGTPQSNAEIVQCTPTTSSVTYGTTIKRVTTAKGAVFAVPSGWSVGNTYYLACRVTSRSGQVSEWSDPVSVSVAPEVAISSLTTSLQSMSISDGSGGTRTVTALRTLPLTVTAVGAGAGGVTSVAIERAEDYIVDRPDETQFNGHAGETVYTFSQNGESQISIAKTDLIGSLDDGAAYYLVVTITDTYGQSASQIVPFEVHWTHQAVVPSGTVSMSNMIAVLRSPQPTGYSSGDTLDVYRLSAEKPTLILQGASFGTYYVDPYPTIGEHGGYRFVFVTANGDYITSTNVLAWVDVEGGVDTLSTIIDFNGERIEIEYDMSISHSWEKDFTETTYLGGSVQGDWNLAVHRTTSVNGDFVTEDPTLIAAMRRLAAYPGICHVRTVDGSSFAADVQVSESGSYERAGKIAAFSLEIKQVDTQSLDGMLQTEWTAS